MATGNAVGEARLTYVKKANTKDTNFLIRLLAGNGWSDVGSKWLKKELIKKAF
jgi:hypothetical protein